MLLNASPVLLQEQACSIIAKYTRGFSGAQLANVVNEAALLAGRKDAKVRPAFALLGLSAAHAIQAGLIEPPVLQALESSALASRA